MTEQPATTQRATPVRRKFLLGLIALVIVAAGGTAVWTTTCPCNRVPGLMLLGDVQEAPVTDWSFANDIPLCQIQISAGVIPHAVNLNCMATPDGALFLSCSGCADKYWSSHVGPNERGRLRLNDRVYPVVLNRVQDEGLLDQAWAARVKKLQVQGGGPYNPVPPPDAKRSASWWSFQLRSAVD